MMKRPISLICLFVGLSVLAACHKTDIVKPADEKKILTVLGYGLMGNTLKDMDSSDQRKALAAEYKALELTESGKSVHWSSSTGNASGDVTPGQPYQVGSQNCRQYVHSFVVNGIPQTARGSACRNIDGSWSPLT